MSTIYDGTRQAVRRTNHLSALCMVCDRKILQFVYGRIKVNDDWRVVNNQMSVAARGHRKIYKSVQSLKS